MKHEKQNRQIKPFLSLKSPHLNKQVNQINLITHILSEIRRVFLDLGLSPIIVSNDYSDEINYVLGNLYCIPCYVDNLGFIIEYAHSHEEAQKHFHGDGDVFPLKMGEEAILLGIKKEIMSELEFPE